MQLKVLEAHGFPVLRRLKEGAFPDFPPMHERLVPVDLTPLQKDCCRDTLVCNLPKGDGLYGECLAGQHGSSPGMQC